MVHLDWFHPSQLLGSCDKVMVGSRSLGVWLISVSVPGKKEFEIIMMIHKLHYPSKLDNYCLTLYDNQLPLK